MLAKRVIACLDMMAGRVVKGVNFVDLVDAGDPVESAKFYDQQGVDEICFLDIKATLDKRDLLFDVLNKTALSISTPLTVGGGVRKIEDIETYLKNGADKVAINSALLTNPELVDKAAARVGSQCIVAAVDAKWDGEIFRVYTHGGTKPSKREAISFCHELQERGAGEILLTSIDRDGTRSGFNTELLNAVSEGLTIPLVASGGAGSKEDFFDVFSMTKTDAALAAGIFHFGDLKIPDLKEYLIGKGIHVRPVA